MTNGHKKMLYVGCFTSTLVRFSKQQYVCFFCSAYTDRIYLKIHFWDLQLILIPSEIVLSKNSKVIFSDFWPRNPARWPTVHHSKFHNCTNLVPHHHDKITKLQILFCHFHLSSEKQFSVVLLHIQYYFQIFSK